MNVKLIDQFYSETGNTRDIIDHLGNFDSVYVEWLEEKLAPPLTEKEQIAETILRR